MGQPLRGDGVTDDTQALMDLFRASSPGVATLPPGRFMTTGLDLAHLSCAISGAGDATVIAALPGQTGPVLDFTGYNWPVEACTIRTIGGFTVEGDGTPGIAKAGIRLGVSSDAGWGARGMAFRDIAVLKTGGPCLDVASSQLCHFERIVLNTPVACVANDVPYILGTGACNGNRFLGIGLRSELTGGDCPRGGAARFVQDAGDRFFAPYANLFQGWWVEYLHPSDGAAIFTIQGSQNAIRDFMFFDIAKEPRATNTAAFRLLLPGPDKENYGSNVVDTFIFGALGCVDVGVDVAQPWNAISGARGKGGANVLLRPTARGTAIDFRGSQQDVSGTPVVGLDGNPARLDATTTVLDRAAGAYELGGGRRWTPDGLFPAAPIKAVGADGGAAWWQGGVLRAKPNKSSKITVLAKP